MEHASLSHTDVLSPDQVVEALLGEVDVKSFVAKIPPQIIEAMQALETRFYTEFKRKKFVSTYHADDRAVELVQEVCNDFLIDDTGSEYNVLLGRALRLSESIRPLFT
jgi:hypothetical protein